MSPRSINHSPSSKESSHELRAQFLSEFMQQIFRVINVGATHQLLTEHARSPLPLESLPPLKIEPQKLHSINTFQSSPKNHLSPLLTKTPAPPAPKTSLPAALQVPTPSPTLQKITIEGLSKIEPFMNDPFVQSVECAGPDKPVVVFKGGTLQTTKLILTGEEINAVLTEIAAKTRIPLIPGIFKAALNNYIITAVISEFVGSRFIIQKNQSMPPHPAPQGH